MERKQQESLSLETGDQDDAQVSSTGLETGLPSGLSQVSTPSMGDALTLINQKEVSTVELEGRRHKVSRTNWEIKLISVTQVEVLAGPSLAAAVSKAIADSMEVNMLAVSVYLNNYVGVPRLRHEKTCLCRPSDACGEWVAGHLGSTICGDIRGPVI